ILTLRYLGFALKQIGSLLDAPYFDLLASLAVQRVVLRERVAELERIEGLLASLVRTRLATGAWDWELLARASAGGQAGLHEKGRLMSDYYTPEQMQHALDKVGQQVGAAEVERAEQGWTALVREVRANQHLNPADPKARALADRWNALTAALYEGFKSDPK